MGCFLDTGTARLRCRDAPNKGNVNAARFPGSALNGGTDAMKYTAVPWPFTARGVMQN
jgi:hypothetical protein